MDRLRLLWPAHSFSNTQMWVFCRIQTQSFRQRHVSVFFFLLRLYFTSVSPWWRGLWALVQPLHQFPPVWNNSSRSRRSGHSRDCTSDSSPKLFAEWQMTNDKSSVKLWTQLQNQDFSNMKSTNLLTQVTCHHVLGHTHRLGHQLTAEVSIKWEPSGPLRCSGKKNPNYYYSQILLSSVGYFWPSNNNKSFPCEFRDVFITHDLVTPLGVTHSFWIDHTNGQ